MRTLKIKNVDCENCARKLEKYISEKLAIESVRIDIMTDKIIISDKKVSAKQIEDIANEIESGVVIIDPKDHSHNHDHNHDHEGDQKMLYRIIISAILFDVGIILKSDIVYLVCYLIIGIPVIKIAIKNMLKRQFFDEFFLMTLATLAAIAIAQIPEAAAVMLFYSVGEYMQARTLAKTKASVTTLEAMRVKDAKKLVDGKIVTVAPSELQIGDTIVVEPGEKVAVDCELIDERASFNTAHITGESKPVTKLQGKEVLAGSIVNGEAAKLQVLREEDDSTIAKLIELITYADSRKTKTEQFITRFSKVYTPIVVFISLALVIFLPLFGIEFNDAVYRAVTLLVISCPCALVLSVPLGYVAAIGRLAEEKILVKGSNAIDQLTKLTTIASDKTGTLTTGHFKVTKFENISEYPSEYIHKIVFAGENLQTHPIAKCLSDYTREFDNNEEVKSENVTGVGIKFEYDNKQILIRKEQVSEAKYSCSAVVIDEQVVARYYMQDEVKAESKTFRKDLQKLGIRLIMLTGDNKQVAQEVGNDLELQTNDIYADLMPEDKLRIVEQQLAGGEKVGFIGDGINDAAVIKRSDVGISMGVGGSALAIENSDIVISNDKINGIIEAIKVSRKADKIIKQNIILAIVVKVTFIILGMFGYTTMWEAVFSDVGVTMIAIVNSLRIRR